MQEEPFRERQRKASEPEGLTWHSTPLQPALGQPQARTCAWKACYRHWPACMQEELSRKRQCKALAPEDLTWHNNRPPLAACSETAMSYMFIQISSYRHWPVFLQEEPNRKRQRKAPAPEGLTWHSNRPPLAACSEKVFYDVSALPCTAILT